MFSPNVQTIKHFKNLLKSCENSIRYFSSDEFLFKVKSAKQNLYLWPESSKVY